MCAILNGCFQDKIRERFLCVQFNTRLSSIKTIICLRKTHAISQKNTWLNKNSMKYVKLLERRRIVDSINVFGLNF